MTPATAAFARRLRSLAAGAAALLLLPAAAWAQADDGPGATEPEALEAVWAAGASFETFLADVEAREATWRNNAARAEVAPDLLDRLAAAGDGWRILAVAEDWCGDSAHTLPYVAALADAAPGVELRVVTSEEGRGIQETQRTPDGRAVTPVFQLMDAEGRDRGCLVERPPELQRWFLAAQDSAADERALYAEKYARYDADAGASTLEEMVRVVEAAAAGERRCLGVPAGAGATEGGR